MSEERQPPPGGTPADEEVVHPTRMEPDPAPPRGAPVHPLSALLLVAVDNLWNLADWTVIGWWVTVPAAFVTVFLPAFTVQRLLKRDGWGRALVLAALLGGLAAVPTSIFGTPVGLALLAWTGLDRILGRPVRTKHS
jgi:hypothetical protein